MKTLLFINQYASTPSYSTGAGERHYFLAKRLYSAGFYSVIISSSFNHLFLKPPSVSGFLTEEPIIGGKIIWVRQSKYKSSNFVARVFSWIDFVVKLFFVSTTRLENPSIVIVSSMSIFPSIFAIFLKRILKIPFVLEVRDIWPLTPILLGGFSFGNPLIRLFAIFEKFTYRHANGIITLLPHFNLYLDSIGIENKPICWIPNAIEDSLYPVSIPISNLSAEATDTFVVCYAGTLGVANAMDCVIESARILQQSYSNIVIKIIGDGSEKRRLMAMASDLTNVEFLGKVPKLSLLDILNSVDVCLISWQDISLYDFGVSANKYNDYMLARKPIISASNMNSDPVKIANCGIQVPSGNPNAIAEAIVNFYWMTRDERQVFGNNGYKFVLNNNTYEIISKKYVEFLNTI